jgi:hypothetical protein
MTVKVLGYAEGIKFPNTWETTRSIRRFSFLNFGVCREEKMMHRLLFWHHILKIGFELTCGEVPPKSFKVVYQWSSTRGARSSGGTWKHLTGYVKLKKKNIIYWIYFRCRLQTVYNLNYTSTNLGIKSWREISSCGTRKKGWTPLVYTIASC